jgi:c-di-GMP-binding flagellar brake protein YcgR
MRDLLRQSERSEMVPINLDAKGEVLRDPRRIAALLNRMLETNALLTVILPAGEARYNTILLDMLESDGELFIDELTPPEGQRLVREGVELRIYASVRGVQFHFSSRILETIEEEDGLSYRIELPESVHYLQRRASYRVSLPRSQAVPVSATLSNGLPLKGFLADLSEGGMRIRCPMPLKQVPYLRKGDSIPTVMFHIETDGDLVQKLEIRLAAYDEHHQELVLGCRFVDSDPRFNQRISHLTMSLQRELRRRMASL